MFVSDDIDYEEQKYDTKCEEDIDRFWNDLQSTSFRTPLGKSHILYV